MITQMRGIRLEDELVRIRQLLQAAEIEFELEGSPKLDNISLITENVLSMCIKEAVTNVVKHSGASQCRIQIEPSRTDMIVRVSDNGRGLHSANLDYKGHGIQGMRERLEFVNGSLELQHLNGTTITVKVPAVIKQLEMEAKEG